MLGLTCLLIKVGHDILQVISETPLDLRIGHNIVCNKNESRSSGISPGAEKRHGLRIQPLGSLFKLWDITPKEMMKHGVTILVFTFLFPRHLGSDTCNTFPTELNKSAQMSIEQFSSRLAYQLQDFETGGPWKKRLD